MMRSIRAVAYALSLLLSTLLLEGSPAHGQPQWISTGPMSAPRHFHHAVPLANGQVLVLGGGTRIAELYNPATRTFAATGSLNVSRHELTATRLLDGRVLVTGGRDGSTMLASAEVYNPATGTFTFTGSMSNSRIRHAAALLPDGRVLITGGQHENTSPPAASAEIYDPASGAFSPAGAMSRGRRYHTATTLPGGRVLVVGGAPLAAGPGDLYDAATGTWSTTAGSTATGAELQAVILLPNGTVLITGGGGAGGPPTFATAEIFDPSTGQFRTTSSMSAVRIGHAASLLPNAMVLVTGGQTVADGTILRSAEIFDPISEQWTTTAQMNVPRTVHTATLVSTGEVLVTSGSNAGATAEVFALENVVWVNIDIKPGSFPNSINLGSAGVVPVAILSSAAFDATQVDPASVSLAGAKVRLIGRGSQYACSSADVNGDVYPDLVCHVVTAQFMIEPGDSIAVLEAETFSGQRIRGEDSIRIVP